MSDSNFGFDYRNNIDNCKFETIYVEIGQISFIKKYENIFDNENYNDFACMETMHEEIEQTYHENFRS